jgi:hypothetical protein
MQGLSRPNSCASAVTVADCGCRRARLFLRTLSTIAVRGYLGEGDQGSRWTLINRGPRQKLRTFLLAQLIALALLAGCGAVAPTDRPLTGSGRPASTEPGKSQSIGSGVPSTTPDELAKSGWFRLITKFPDPDSLGGFDLEVGTLDGNLARVVSTQFGPLAPSAAYRGALPTAAGPFGDIVLLAFWDGVASELHSVSVTSGEDVILTRRDDIIHAVTFEPRSDSIFLLTLDPVTRADRGIFRMARDKLGPADLLTKPEPALVKEGEQVWKRLWVTPNGKNLVLVDCPTDCFASVYSIDGNTTSSRQPMLAGQDVAGVTNDAVVAVFGCKAPCPATSYDFGMNAAHPVGSFCETGTVVFVDGEASLVSDRPVKGDCRSGSYLVARTDLGNGHDAPVLLEPTRDRTLVSMDASQGAAPPEGWFLVGPAGQLVGLGAQRQISPSLVRAIDGAIFHLPILGPPRS